jgi:membrane protein DedA with SNARE-associated domain
LPAPLNVLGLVERHGSALLFLWVFAQQSGIPLPVAPLLCTVGALIHVGRLHLVPPLLSCVVAAVAADTIWFELGRHRGFEILRFVCRLSFEPDSCARRTKNTFQKYGMNTLLISKFFPGLNTITAVMAGYCKSSYVRFAGYDLTGALIWSGAYIAVGCLFSRQLGMMICLISKIGADLLLLLAALYAIWIARNLLQRLCTLLNERRLKL